ncbi:MAG: cytochrome ubiquinol oxidase subunit I [Thermoanaerobaculales bacterium]|jgi:mono/diheme cytochrome c family protein|nr:cytochrome ubiquinol oxidase subunit I [Thermoanaerobaculales bacterium]
MDYPIWNVAMGGGVLMAWVAITHVIVSHFAIGGGLVIVVTETLAVRRSDPELRELARRASLVLILVSTVFGAISGVGIWVVAGLISPGAISALIHTYVWGWAIEWVFFVLEIVAALVYYTTWDKISKGAHVLVGWLYFIGAYLSLVIINGIVTYMLTPGSWLESRAFWDGFFNPTYWPSLVLRTGICILMAVAFMLWSAYRAPADRRPDLVRYLGWWFLGGALVSYAGYRWWEAMLPDTVTALFLGDAPTLATLADTRSFALWSLTVALVVAVIALLAAPRLARGVTALVLMAAAFAFFGGYERLREGVRKPFLVHSHIFSNGLLVSQIETINRDGIAAHSGWVAAGDPSPEALGERIFRTQCSSCHTLDGYQAIRPALPTVTDMELVVSDGPGAGAVAYEAQCSPCHGDVEYDDMVGMLPTVDEIREDPDFIRELNLGMITLTVLELREMGEEIAAFDRTSPFDMRELTHPAMPPFVGTDEEAEALAVYLASLDRTGAEAAAQGGAQ